MPPLQIEPHDSWIFFGFIVFTHLFAWIMVIYCALPPGWWAIILLSFIQTLARPRIKKIYWSLQQGWYLVTEQPQLIPLNHLSAAYVTRYLVILHFRINKYRTRAIILFYDALDTETFRRLRVFLLTQSQSAFHAQETSSIFYTK